MFLSWPSLFISFLPSVQTQLFNEWKEDWNGTISIYLCLWGIKYLLNWEATCQVGDVGSIPGSGRSPGEGNGNPLQYSSLGNPMDRRCLAGYSSWGCKESDTTQWLNHIYLFTISPNSVCWMNEKKTEMPPFPFISVFEGLNIYSINS